VPFTREPVTTANGARVAFFRDPDGTLIEMIEGDLIFTRR
jgi:catechol 2,3-dioxygenase-like lactoylglutathione lyase family enzyme